MRCLQYHPLLPCWHAYHSAYWERGYLAFLVEGDGILNIRGAKYELTKDNYFIQKVYTSNEFINQPVTVTLDKGYVIVIESRDWR